MKKAKRKFLFTLPDSDLVISKTFTQAMECQLLQKAETILGRIR